MFVQTTKIDGIHFSLVIDNTIYIRVLCDVLKLKSTNTSNIKVMIYIIISCKKLSRSSPPTSNTGKK